MVPSLHPDFEALVVSWRLAMEAESFAANSIRTYTNGLGSLGRWAAEHAPGVGPLELARDQLRAWIADLLANQSRSTARLYFTGAKQFYEWAVAEDELDASPMDGLTTPRPGETYTPVLSTDELTRLFATCNGKSFPDRRDNAILRVFADAGLRLAEMGGMDLPDFDVRERIVYVVGKGAGRSGPRSRAVPVGIRTAQSIDRYLRERRKHAWASHTALWLGPRGRFGLSGIKAMVGRRGAQAGLDELHPHILRHVFGHYYRANGGEEGDLMLLGGWRSRAQLDRYGASASAERAREAGRKLALGDRL